MGTNTIDYVTAIDRVVLLQRDKKRATDRDLEARARVKILQGALQRERDECERLRAMCMESERANAALMVKLDQILGIRDRNGVMNPPAWE